MATNEHLLNFDPDPLNEADFLNDQSLSYNANVLGAHSELHERNDQSIKPKVTSRRQPPPVPHNATGDFEAREEVWARELEEARTRLGQMEKTMR